MQFGLKLGLKPNSSAQFKTILKTGLCFQTEVNPNYPVSNRNCEMHLDRQFCWNSSVYQNHYNFRLNQTANVYVSGVVAITSDILANCLSLKLMF